MPYHAIRFKAVLNKTMLGRILLGAFYGIIAVLGWDIALSLPLLAGWIYAIIIGSVISLYFFIMARVIIVRGTATEKEAYMNANTQMLYTFVGSIIIAVIVGLIRLVIHFV